jgi:hypothetical protein
MLELNQSQNTIKQIARLERQAINTRKGRVIALSPQGDVLYCIVRRPDHIEIDSDGAKVRRKGVLFGNEADISEDEITLQEVLIESNIHLGYTFFDIKHLLGIEVLVEMVDGAPRKVHMNPSSPDARVIPSAHIWKARSTNPGRSLRHKSARAMLENYGYSKKQISSVISETVKSVSPEGQVLRYGDTATWQISSTQALEGKDISSDVSIVTNIPTRTLKKTACHRPGLAFTGK